jgi:hypothetical protein
VVRLQIFNEVGAASGSATGAAHANTARRERKRGISNMIK